MTSPEGGVSAEDQIAAVARAAEPIADVVAGGTEVVITHGNGPQVGNLLVKNELAASVVPPVPLDWCGAQTQGTIGAMLINALERSLAARGVGREVAAIVTRTRVDPADPLFAKPTKPIGRYLPEPEARVMIDHGQVWEDRGEKGWRRVVASPEPLEILDAPAVAALMSAGFVVVAAGGGGIPVVRDSRRLRARRRGGHRQGPVRGPAGPGRGRLGARDRHGCAGGGGGLRYAARPPVGPGDDDRVAPPRGRGSIHQRLHGA